MAKRLRYYPQSNISTRLPPNFIIDKMIKAATFEYLRKMSGVAVGHLDLDNTRHHEWIQHYHPRWRGSVGDLRDKKLLEFYASFTLLNPKIDDAFMDAAGGRKTYIDRLNCKTRYLQDSSITPDIRDALGNAVDYIEGDATSVQLADGTLDKISVHHSFEHFQGNGDTLFIMEVQRLLRPMGRCCIVPIFIADHYVEITNEFTFSRQFDPGSRVLIDPSASLPGGKRSGYYARVYDLEAFKRRILSHIDSTAFRVSISELRLNGSSVPDLRLSCHKTVSAINRPLRAMLIERVL
jgi:hypothetical protein